MIVPSNAELTHCNLSAKQDGVDHMKDLSRRGQALLDASLLERCPERVITIGR